MQLLKVALAHAMGRLLDYLPPETLSIEQCPLGCRVLVPFGSRKLIGVIASHGEATVASAKLRPALELLDPSPLFAERDMSLLLWAADYYLADPGAVFMQALPKDLRIGVGSKVHLSGWRLCPDNAAIKLSKAQRNAIDILRDLGGKAEAMVLQGFGIAANTISSLQASGAIERDDSQKNTKPSFQWSMELTTEQQQAIDAIPHEAGSFSVSVLDGVTGSGKTEVYMRLAADVLAQGKQVVILVPEIGLTPQTLGRFQLALQTQIVTMHSALGDTQRSHSWQAIASGSAQLLIGTRSAILPPCHNLGLIIVDEEHDSSYKQQNGFRYNARDLAVAKGSYYQCPVVLGSATPSLATLHNIKERGYNLVRLRKRATGAELPTIHLLDLHKEQVNPAGIAEQSLALIQEQLDDNKQVLVFVNRRGFAQSLFCHACGWQAMCDNCDARMTLHYSPARLVCHHCQAVRHLPMHCQSCSSSWLSAVGTGTEQITESLERKFPSTRVIRIDQDSVRGKGKLQARLHEVRSIQPALLVGTQMLAKGHDFPALSLVIVVGADNGLYSTDFRAIERTCQLLLQVSGRAGRHGRGRVIIQSSNVQSPYLQAVQAHNYSAISRTLLAEREEAGMPPYSHLILIRAEGSSLPQITQTIEAQARTLRGLSKDIEVFGPFEPSVQKLAKKYRRQLMLIGNRRPLLNAVCRHWQQHYLPVTSGRNAIRWSIDVDPYDIF